MYICLCFGVTDKVIKKTVAESDTCSIRQLTKQLGFGTQCGKCLCHTKTLLEEVKQERDRSTENLMMTEQAEWAVQV